MCVILHMSLSQNGNSALMWAAQKGETKVVVELMKAGVNLNLQDEVQRLSILCMFTTYIQHMMYMNKTALYSGNQSKPPQCLFCPILYTYTCMYCCDSTFMYMYWNILAGIPAGASFRTSCQ